MRELIEAFDACDGDHEVGVVVLCGAGSEAFSTGGDVGMEDNLNGVAGREIARLLLRLSEAVRGTGKPVLGALGKTRNRS
jgi:naphthoate synthase